MRVVPCPACEGARLRPASLAVTVGGKNIHEVGELSIRDCAAFFRTVELSERDRMIAERVFKEINERLQFLLDVGLDYLSLNRIVGHAGGRRGAAHPARVADRQRARRRALRARRTVDRPAPARQPAPHRDAHAPARPRQHRDRRRARRGDDPGRRPRRRHRSRCGRARRRDHRLGHRRRTCSSRSARSPGSTCRASARSRCPSCGATRARRGSRVRGRARAQPRRTSTSRSRSGASSPSPG